MHPRASSMCQLAKTTGRSLWAMAGRRKQLADETSELARVLSLLDLTALGVGSTLGLGVYVLAGSVARNQAGPAVVLSFAIAAVASFFAGLCYAEFAARVPKAGSAYVYAYVAVGEAVAFIIGWTLVLEYAIGTASVSRGVSSYLDNLLDKSIGSYLNATMHIDAEFLAPYPDFLSLGIIVVMTILLAIGVKESTVVNNVFTLLNMLTAATAIITGSLYADPKNWNILPEDIPPHFAATAGEGGFLPFGMKGVIAGAATCFFGYVGFDCIATTSEEAKNPRRNIPWAIVLSLIVICGTYISIASVLTLMWPYYDQDVDAPFTYIFNLLDLKAVRWIVTIGAIFALTTSLIGCMFPLPRVLYAMSQDGLLFAFLGTVHGWTQTPVNATLLGGSIAGVMALIFDLQQLIEMMSIGTLLAYSIVGLCVLVLRYTDRGAVDVNEKKKPQSLKRSIGALVNWERSARPTPLSTGAAGILVLALTALCLALSVLLSQAGDRLYNAPGEWAGSLLALGVPLLVVLFMLYRQPTADLSELSFRVPGLPLVPAISLFMNTYLMVELTWGTWLRFIIWMFVGLVVYFTYSVRHSAERSSARAQRENINLPDNLPKEEHAPASAPTPAVNGFSITSKSEPDASTYM